MESKIPKLDLWGQLVDQELLRHTGEENLASVTGRQQPRAAVENLTVILALPELSLAAVQRHPDFQGHFGRPAFSGEGALQREGTRRRVHRPGEDGQDAVPSPSARQLR